MMLEIIKQIDFFYFGVEQSTTKTTTDCQIQQI